MELIITHYSDGRYIGETSLYVNGKVISNIRRITVVYGGGAWGGAAAGVLMEMRATFGRSEFK
jgi:hypothetical protein